MQNAPILANNKEIPRQRRGLVATSASEYLTATRKTTLAKIKTTLLTISANDSLEEKMRKELINKIVVNNE